EEQSLKIGADVRRQLFLIFKEGVNNIVRHSGCRSAEIDLNVADNRLILTMKDDGRGFDATRTHDGNGLVNMRSRASRVTGSLRIESTSGHGTTVTVSVPLNATVRDDDSRLHPSDQTGTTGERTT